METLSLQEEGGVPCPCADIRVLEDDTLTHTEEKKSPVAEHNRKTFSTTLCQDDTCRAAAGVEVSHGLDE